jgi:hypothetical protein
LLRALLNPCWRSWDRIEKNEAAEEDAPTNPDPPSKQEIVDENRNPAAKVYLVQVTSDALVLEPNMSRYTKRIDFTFLSAPWTS